VAGPLAPPFSWGRVLGWLWKICSGGSGELNRLILFFIHASKGVTKFRGLVRAQTPMDSGRFVVVGGVYE
jgi:hypothetical protein